jgi:hypothetical protein
MRAEIELADACEANILLKVLTSLKRGNFSVRMPEEWTGLQDKIADALNEIIDTHERMAKELSRVSREVGRKGQLSQRAALAGAQGGWAGMVDSVNTLIDDLVRPTTEMSRVVLKASSAARRK